MKKVRIGSGSAYWGDVLEPAIEMVEKGEVDYIGFDHLAELTMSILQRVKAKDNTKGYIPDIVPWMKVLLPLAYKKGVKLITNAGGANPEAAGKAVQALATELGLAGLKIGIVTGDDIFEKIDELVAKGIPFRNLETGEEDFSSIRDRIIAANAYTGADKIVEALAQGADIVITGRVSDNAVFVGPLMHEFGWDFSEAYLNKIGAAITVGHVIECAECCTGGMSNVWQDANEMWKVGFPIAEVYENGDAIITKVPGSGGLINQWTIKEHLVYEIHDPANYIMPDGIADFTTLNLEEIGKDQVKLSNMSGKARPKDLKVQIGYQDGWIAEGTMLLPWPDALGKAKRCEQILRERLKVVNLKADELRIDYVGVNTLGGSTAPEPTCELNEVGLRLVARTRTKEEAAKIRREITHLWTLGAVGSSIGVPTDPRPIISLWPTLVPREEVSINLVMKEVN